jgi:hypothetical protein
MKILTKRLLISPPVPNTPLADSSPRKSILPITCRGLGNPGLLQEMPFLLVVPSFREGVGFEGKEGVGDGLTKRGGRRRSGGISPHEPEKKRGHRGRGQPILWYCFLPLLSQHGWWWWCNRNTQGSLQIGLAKDSRSTFPYLPSTFAIPSASPFLAPEVFG